MMNVTRIPKAVIVSPIDAHDAWIGAWVGEAGGRARARALTVVS